MMLKSIRIYGLFDEYNYDVELSNGLITFFHSQNGFGKSTIMRLIYNVLSGNLEEVKISPFERIDLGFDDDTALIVENDSGDLLVQMQKNEVTEPITEQDLKNIFKVIYLSPERLALNQDGCMVPALNVYLSELYEKRKYAGDHCELVPVPKKGRKEYTDSELEFWCKDLKAKLEFIKQAGFEPDMPPSYRFPPTRYEIMEYREEYTDLAFSIKDYVDRFYNLAESLIVYMDILNNLFVNKSIGINEGGFLVATMDNGVPIPLDKLSSGEKQILVIFFVLLFHAEKGSLVMVDEPEMSLHISWQQQIGKTFIDIARLRSLHIIVATHSPQIIHDNWDLAEELVP